MSKIKIGESTQRKMPLGDPGGPWKAAGAPSPINSNALKRLKILSRKWKKITGFSLKSRLGQNVHQIKEDIESTVNSSSDYSRNTHLLVSTLSWHTYKNPLGTVVADCTKISFGHWKGASRVKSTLRDQNLVHKQEIEQTCLDNSRNTNILSLTV